ncbi:MAG: rimM [Solirubrobacteraceae bacterium]|nr:rimM [Solirubrobacteraceae bacterium]
MGSVGRPHGLDGSFHVFEPMPAALPVGAQVRIGETDTEIVARKGTDAQPILRLALATDRTAIEALRGRALTVEKAVVPALGEDEYWADDLAGCEVVAGDRSLGVVERMVAYPSCEVLVVGEHLVPLVSDAIRSVDVAARRIEVDAEFLGL